MSDVKALVARAQERWEAGDVEGWLAMFHEDAKLFVPGETAVSGDHDKASFREVGERLLRAVGDSSGQWVIDTYVSPNGAVCLVDQKVDSGGETLHYHAMLLYELKDPTDDRFAFWWLMVHEYDAFAAAWA